MQRSLARSSWRRPFFTRSRRFYSSSHALQQNEDTGFAQQDRSASSEALHKPSILATEYFSSSSQALHEPSNAAAEYSSSSESQGQLAGEGTSLFVAPSSYAQSYKPSAWASLPRLWAMQRGNLSKRELIMNLRAWRIPGALESGMQGFLPSTHIYLDRLQLHQHFWKRGFPTFLCTRFVIDIYDFEWDRDKEKTQLKSSVLAYPQLVNLNGDDEIINMTVVDPRKWGKRCPVIFCGEDKCIGLQKGGILKRNIIYLPFQCDHELEVPDVTVDVSHLDIHDKITIEQLNLPYTVTSNLQPDAPVCTMLPHENSHISSETHKSMEIGCLSTSVAQS